MRTRLAVPAVAAAVAALLLAGCSSPETSPAAPVPPGEAASLPGSPQGVTPDFLESLRAGYQGAYNGLPLDKSLPYEDYVKAFEPLWQQATDAGVTLYRRPVEQLEGFSLSAQDALTPGHALFLEVSSASSSWCIADTEVLPDALTTAQQRNDAATPPKEFAVVDGPCTVLVDDLAQRLESAEG